MRWAAQAMLAEIERRRQELDRVRVRLEHLAELCREGDDADCVALRIR